MKLFRNITRQLSEVYPQGEASALARWVMEERFGLSLSDLMMDKDSELSAQEQQELQNITERLLQKEPVQYILGQIQFCGLCFQVAPGVLIPRPETQELVEWICEENISDGTAPSLRVLDIGTGSGCIAISLAHRGFYTEAWDISEEALAIAKRNAERLKTNVQFKKKDILQIEVQEDAIMETERPTMADSITPYNIIVSNPPYICREEAKDMDTNVLEYEPHLALFVPNADPLLFYRHIAMFGTRHLVIGGQLFFEINRKYGQDICHLLTELGYSDVIQRNDQFDAPRMISAKWQRNNDKI